MPVMCISYTSGYLTLQTGAVCALALTDSISCDRANLLCIHVYIQEKLVSFEAAILVSLLVRIHSLTGARPARFAAFGPQ